MGAIRAVRPLSGAAVGAADASFYRAHPEMVVNGRRIPLDPCDPAQAAMRQEWMNSYQAHGGRVEPVRGDQLLLCQSKVDQSFPPAPLANTTRPCPGDGQAKANCAPVRTPPPKTAETPPCELVRTSIKCEHGREIGPEGILMVVPDSTASAGDEIVGSLSMKGGCGTHPSWSIGGYWNSSGNGTKFNFNAATWIPSGIGLFSLKRAAPHVYRCTTSACSGGPQAWEVRAYPPGGVAAKVDVKGVIERIHNALKHLPMPEDKLRELEKDWLKGSIDYEGAWKEDSKSWKAYYEMSITGGFDPLFGLRYKGPIYPLTLAPGWLSKWVKAGLFWEMSAGATCSLGVQGKYWPDVGKSTWTEKTVKGGVEGTGALSLELKLASSDLVEGAIVGETGLEGEISGTFGDEPSADVVLRFPGIKGKATLKAAWGWVEFSREFQLMKERELLKYNLLSDQK